MSTENIFKTEQLVIVTSKIAIDHLEWRKYMLQNWSKLMRPKSKCLVLAGIHGNPDGSLGDPDSGLLNDYQRQIQFLVTKKRKQEVEDNEISFILEDVSKHIKDGKLDNLSLVKTVKTHGCTLLILAFCFTEMSELNDLFREYGIYSTMIMTQDRISITAGKYVNIELDQGQKEIIEYVAENQPKNIFLWGSSGTGKTLLLAQVLGMKISHYFRKSIKLKVFVSSYFSENEKNQLLMDLKEKYLSHLIDEDFVTFVPLDDLCKGKITEYHFMISNLCTG